MGGNCLSINYYSSFIAITGGRQEIQWISPVSDNAFFDQPHFLNCCSPFKVRSAIRAIRIQKRYKMTIQHHITSIELLAPRIRGAKNQHFTQWVKIESLVTTRNNKS
jgi:hypothetical protein